MYILVMFSVVGVDLSLLLTGKCFFECYNEMDLSLFFKIRLLLRRRDNSGWNCWFLDVLSNGSKRDRAAQVLNIASAC